MRKILLFLLLLGVVVNTTIHLPGETKDEKNKPDLDPSSQLQLFQLSEYLSRLYLHLPPVFNVPGLTLKLKPPPRTRLVRFDWKPKRRLGRAIWTGVGHFIWSTSSYWIRLEENREDWEYQFTLADQKKRFLFIDGMRFDSNSFQFNWTHSGAGALYYNYARANRLNPLGSFLYGFAASYFWEFVVEFREVVSVNDMIGTPVGGFSIGEALFQLGRYARSKRPTFANKIGRFLSNPILSLYDWMDRKKVKNQFAFEEDYWNDAKMFAGPRYDSFFPGDTNNYFSFGVETELILLPEYGAPEAVARVANEIMSTQFDLGITTGSGGVYELSAFAKAAFFGYFAQNIRSTGDKTRDRSGYSFFIGAASAFDLFKEIPGKISVNDNGPALEDYSYKIDKFAIVNMIGPTIDLSLFHEGFKMRVSADAYFDFSLIHSHAFKRYSELYSFGQTKSTLEEHGYYYAFGFTLSSMLQLKYSNLELKGKMKYHYFNSIEGLDRFQVDVKEEDDFGLTDKRFIYNLSLGYRVPRTPIQLVLGLEETDRKGFIGDFRRHSQEKRTYFQIRYKF
ncbi:MAG: DUF3943 domain-containing protein [bacterium]|nr:DUF3943 domain-containing protein [bacterium]